MGDEIETMRSVMGNEIKTMRLRQRDQDDEIETTRSAAPMSIRSRTRSVLGGSVLGGDDLDAGVRSRWWCDLGGTISAA